MAVEGARERVDFVWTSRIKKLKELGCLFLGMEIIYMGYLGLCLLTECLRRLFV